MLVISCTLNMRQSSSRSARDRYPLSPNSFPKSLRASLGMVINITRGKHEIEQFAAVINYQM